MNRILVTGARAPSALEIMRRLATAGYEVHTADCLHYPPARFSSHNRGYLRYPSPRYDLTGFRDALNNYITTHAIDLIFPTCEEVFFLSYLKSQLKCRVFCEDLPLLANLHNKATFQTLAQRYGMGSISTTVIETLMDPNLHTLPNNTSYVAKPVYSRFGDKAVLDLSADQIGAHLKPELFPWAVQAFIAGQEYCTYALCRNGQVLAQACYKPAYRAGKGSSVYFQPVHHVEIFRQIAAFVRGTNFSGQIGFDFIEQADGRVFVLECNPRATSGAHLLAVRIDWDTLFTDLGVMPGQADTPSMRARMVGLAMLAFGMRAPNQQSFDEFWQAYKNADDVMAVPCDRLPVYGQFISLAEIFWRSWTSGLSLKDASTADIEWDGEPLA